MQLWIGKENRENVVDRVVENLLDHAQRRNYSLMIPPGFGEADVPREIFAALRASPGTQLVAHLKLDALNSTTKFLAALYSQWSGKRPDNEFRTLGEVLSHFREYDRRFIVMSRFHKILEHLDEKILVDLRDAEQAGEIQSAVACIYPLQWIKDEWKERGNALMASDYGDMHTQLSCKPLGRGEVFSHFEGYRGSKMSWNVLSMAFTWTGGIPSHMIAIVDAWIDGGCPDSTDDQYAMLYRIAIEQADQIARELDEKNEGRFRDLIIRMQSPNIREQAHHRMSQVHPWAEILLDSSGLRVEALGDACVKRKVRECIRIDSHGDPVTMAMVAGRECYEAGQFQRAWEFYSALPVQGIAAEASLIRDHSKAMAVLFGRGVDVNWTELEECIDLCRTSLSRLEIAERDKFRIERRYTQLQKLAQTVSNAAESGSRRLVDTLAGKHPSEIDAEAAMAAMTLLSLQLESARGAVSNTVAITSILSLPEQIFRIWSLWVLDLHMNLVPSNAETAWQSAANAWRLHRNDELRIPNAGEKFPGFIVFVYFAVAKLLLDNNRQAEQLLILNFEALQKFHFLFDWRNDPAHATVVFDTKSREMYIGICADWLRKLCDSCPVENVSFDIARDVLAPLPIVENRTVLWGGH
jgi:hypothetical protein